jgi:superfamily II DNA or RNA helicase
MEFTTAMPWLSWPQEPRRGQNEAFTWIWDASKSTLNIKFPTAYGKTCVANGCLHLLHMRRGVNRALMIVPQEGQHDQYTRSCVVDFADVGLIVEKDVIVIDLRNESYNTIMQTILNNREKLIVYVTTIQMLHAHTRPGKDHHRRELLHEIFKEPNTRWAFIIDEYHHYGEGLAWGEVFKHLPEPVFRLAMSATPYRPGQDDFFGKPDIQILYRAAVDEAAVKPLACHVYDYWIEMTGPSGQLRMTTREHDERMHNQDLLPRAEITLPLRYREDYIAPLLEYPLDRLIETRSLKHPWAQAIIYCARIDHATHVYGIVDKMFGEALRIAVVAAHPDYEKSNNDALTQFCPATRTIAPEIDVLICVGMAGEGLNTIYVTEIIHLNAETTVSNTGNQKKGRASRVLRDKNGEMMIGHINVDGSSAYRKYVGQHIMDAMDFINLPEKDEPPAPPAADDDGSEPAPPFDPASVRPQPDEPDLDLDMPDEDDFGTVPKRPKLPLDVQELSVLEMGLEGINTGEQFLLADAIADAKSPMHMREFTSADKQPGSPRHEELMQTAADILSQLKKRSPANKVADRMHLRGQVTLATREASKRVCKLMRLDPKTRKGEVMYCINSHRVRLFNVGINKASIDQLKQHYGFTVQLDFEMANTGQVPRWLRENILL